MQRTRKKLPLLNCRNKRKPYEVSRMFVSLLQMANDGTISIQNKGEMGNVEIRLMNHKL